MSLLGRLLIILKKRNKMGWHQEAIQKIGNYCEQKFGKMNVSVDTSNEKRALS